MDSRANVKSLAALELFHQQIGLTQSELMRLAELIRVELDKLTDYLQKQAPAYWKHQFQRAQEKLEEARIALSRCEQVTRESERKSCFVEKKQVAVAKQRVELCESKLRLLKTLNQEWQQERLKTQSHLQQVLDVAETGLPTAQLTLAEILKPLRQYASLGDGDES